MTASNPKSADRLPPWPRFQTGSSASKVQNNFLKKYKNFPQIFSCRHLYLHSFTGINSPFRPKISPGVFIYFGTFFSSHFPRLIGSNCQFSISTFLLGRVQGPNSTRTDGLTSAHRYISILNQYSKDSKLSRREKKRSDLEEKKCYLGARTNRCFDSKNNPSTSNK